MMCSTPAARECKPKKKGARANLCNALSLPVESVANPNDVVEDVFAQEIADCRALHKQIPRLSSAAVAGTSRG